MTIVLTIIAILLGLLVLWRVASAIDMRLYRPLFWSLDDYQKQLFARFKFPAWVNAAEFERTTLAVGDGVVLSLYILKGPPGSPVVVFMPGTAVYAELYSNFLFSVHRRGYTVIGYDPRGHGQSGRLRGMFDLPQLVADAQKVCAYAKQRFGTKVGFSGSSQGGITAFYLAATGDPNVDTVMCHNIAYADGDSILEISVFKPPVWAVPLLVRLFTLMRAFAVPVTFYLPFNKLKLPNGKPALPLLQADPMATRAYSLVAVASLAITPLATPIDKIKMPLMLLSSTWDEVFPVAYERMLFGQLTCERQFVLIPDQYHLMLVFSANEPWLLDPVVAWFDKHLR